MALIAAYTLTPRALCFEGHQASVKSYNAFLKKNGGFDPKKKTVKAMKWNVEAGFEFWPYLDSITGAVEAGLIDDEKWPEQLFASKEDLAKFAAGLHGYDETWRITDRWYQALGLLGDFDDVAVGVVNCAEMADTIWARAIEDLSAFKAVTTRKVAAKKVAAKKAAKKKVAAKKAVPKKK